MINVWNCGGPVCYLNSDAVKLPFPVMELSSSDEFEDDGSAKKRRKKSKRPLIVCDLSSAKDSVVVLDYKENFKKHFTSTFTLKLEKFLEFFNPIVERYATHGFKGVLSDPRGNPFKYTHLLAFVSHKILKEDVRMKPPPGVSDDDTFVCLESVRNLCDNKMLIEPVLFYIISEYTYHEPEVFAFVSSMKSRDLLTKVIPINKRCAYLMRATGELDFVESWLELKKTFPDLDRLVIVVCESLHYFSFQIKFGERIKVYLCDSMDRDYVKMKKQEIFEQIHNNILALHPEKVVIYKFRDGLKQSHNNCLVVSALSTIWFADNSSFDFEKLGDTKWGSLVRENMAVVLVGYLVGLLK
jgi:hypothetical protein